MAPHTITHPQQRSADPRDGGSSLARVTDGPEDNAHYSCACGHQFAGSVSTHVACPRCGGEQDW